MKCPVCNGEISVNDQWIGMQTTCPLCQNQITIQQTGPDPVMPAQTPQMAQPLPGQIPVNPQMAQPFPGQQPMGMAPMNQFPKAPKKPKTLQEKIFLARIIACGVCVFFALVLFVLGSLFSTRSRTTVYNFNCSSDGSKEWSSSVTVGESSYATAKNTRMIIDNTSRAADNIYYQTEEIRYRTNFFNWGYFCLFLALLALIFPKPEEKKKEE